MRVEAIVKGGGMKYVVNFVTIAVFPSLISLLILCSISEIRLLSMHGSPYLYSAVHVVSL